MEDYLKDLKEKRVVLSDFEAPQISRELIFGLALHITY